jgi:hypothetical protein
MGSPAFPFIDQGRGLGYTGEKEREEKKNEKNRREESSGTMFLFPLQADPIRPVATPCHVPATSRCCHSVVAFCPVTARGVVNSSP